MSAEQQACLLCVMAEGFALDEVRLFLDTHPGDTEALQYLAQRQAACRAAQENYVARFAPPADRRSLRRGGRRLGPRALALGMGGMIHVAI